MNTTTTTTMLSSSSLRSVRFVSVNLGNVDGGRLLSALHNNTFITQLFLYNVGLEGRTGGTIISNLLQHNRCLTTLYCFGNRFGAAGAIAMSPGIRGNSTLKIIDLGYSQLGDEGIAHIADAFLRDHDGNNNTTTAVTHLCLHGNGITPNGLPTVTRLKQHLNLSGFSIDHNPHLFDNQDDFQQFLIALQTSTVSALSMGHCQLSVHQMIEIFETLLLTTTPICFIDVYDNDQLQHGTELEHLLKIIPQLQIFRLCVNLDFTDSTVLSSFHRNTSIYNLFRDFDGYRVEITDGTVFDIVKRNRRLFAATHLLDSKHGRTTTTIPWAKAIKRLGEENTGATAVYKIIQEKLVLWWPTGHSLPSPPPPPPRPFSNVVVVGATTTARQVATSAAAAAVVAAPQFPSLSTTTETDAGLLLTTEQQNHDSDETSSTTNSTTTTNNIHNASTMLGDDDNERDDEMPPPRKRTHDEIGT